MSVKKVESIKSSGKRKNELDKVVNNINGFYHDYREELGDLNPNDGNDMERARTFFARKTESLRNEIKTYIALGYDEDTALKRVLPKAYATVKLASGFLWNKPHYDVQLIGGILLNDGYASEMATGEGKTQTAALPTYLNALLGKGAHVITPNGYLAQRDYEEMSELYRLMGLTCGLVEERGRISEEKIHAKVLEILQTRLDKYTAGAKTEEERQTLITAFFNDRKNSTIIQEAREKARTSLKTEETLRRREAYAADVTYGSASAIAFDYLYDDIETDTNNIVQRAGNPNFAVVDEVDAVLFDDATTPFSLSGTQTDEELAISAEDRKAAERRISGANYAVYRIRKENEELIRRNREIGRNDCLVLEIKDEHSFENLITGDSPQAEEYDMTRALIINSSTKEYKLTTLGETILFQYYHLKDINRILLEHRDSIIGMQHDGKPLYREGYDYKIVNNRIVMEPRAFAHLVMSGSVPELTADFNKFGLNELKTNHVEIDNALKAWFVLEEDVDYKLSVPSNAKKPNERVVSLVMNGRTAEGRVYSNGLQQAIEQKERWLKKKTITIRDTKIKNTLASIPTASFFGRYGKFAGMTGTAAVSAFRELYGLETHEVPRNKPRQVIDHGDRMYPSSEEKNEAIFQEVLTSYKKNQPVLISTTSIEESEKLYRYLNKRFSDMGITINIPVLNANVDKLQEEAAIVSRAGLPGAITISTEMAGRGTDIKLGGEVPDIGDLMQTIGEERVQKTLEVLKAKGILNDANKDKLEQQVRKNVFAKEDDLEREAKRRHEVLKGKKDAMEREILAAGGLKVIGSGHFSYSRVDDQVKGRCGRQGNKGEIIFFNDREDLLKIGVPKSKADELQQQAQISPIIENPQTGYTPLGDVIYVTQARTESTVQMSIKQSQEIENEVANYRRVLRVQRDELKRSGDYIDAVEYMIEETVKSVIMRSSTIEHPSFTDKTRISKANIDQEEFASLASEFLGVDISEEEIRQFKTLGELREFVTNKSLELYHQRIAEQGREKTNADSKEIVDKLLTRTWNDFEGYVDHIKHQNMLNRMAQMQTEGQIPHQIGQAFGHCVESERAMIVRELVNPDYRKKIREPRTELVPVRVLIEGVKRVDRDYDKRTKDEVAQMEQEAFTEKTNPSNITNLQPRPRIFTLVNKARLNKNASTLGVRKPPADEEIESVDFGDGPKGK